jgi:hypothetical protein
MFIIIFGIIIFINGSTAHCWALVTFLVSCSCTQSIGLLGGGSPSQGLYPHVRHKLNKRTHRQPCLGWDSKPQSQCLRGRRQFML